MPKIKFTKSEIDKLKFTTEKGEQVTYWDTLTPGLGLVVGARSKTFRLQLDVKDTTKAKGYRTVKKTLGRYGEITLEEAKAMMTGYIDKETGEAVPSERLKLKQIDGTNKAGDSVTLRQLVKSYYSETKRRDGKERRESSALRYQELIAKHYEEWMDLPLKDINNLTPAIVIEYYKQLAAKRGPLNARVSTSALSAVLNYGLAKFPGTLRASPIAILTSRHVNVMEKPKARHECLNYDTQKHRNDFKVFYDSLLNAPELHRDLYLLTLFTGMRKMEATALRWDQVDLKHAEINIEDTKNRHSLHIPANRQTLEILNRRHKTAGPVSPFVFSSEVAFKTGHAAVRSAVLKKATGLDITIHGLRRTFTTVGRRLKRFEDTSRLTNHIDNSVEGKHYDETGVEDLRESSQLIADTIERYMKESTDNVIQFPGMARAA